MEPEGSLPCSQERKITKILSQGNQSPGRDFNPGPPEHETVC
jgi:hypothetical protein